MVGRRKRIRLGELIMLLRELFREILGERFFRDHFTSDDPIVAIAVTKGRLYVATKSRIYCEDEQGKLTPVIYSSKITPPNDE